MIKLTEDAVRKLLSLTWAISVLITLTGVTNKVWAQNQRVLELVAQHPKTTFAIHICHADTGKTILDYQSEKPLIPASNMKLITTATAVDILGADFTYQTKAGLLGNNLVIITPAPTGNCSGNYYPVNLFFSFPGNLVGLDDP